MTPHGRDPHADLILKANGSDRYPGLMFAGGMGDQFDEAAFRAHFGSKHDLWVSHQGGGMAWAATAPHAAHSLASADTS